MQLAKKYPKSQVGGNSPITVMEKGEYFKDTQGKVLKVSSKMPTHDDRKLVEETGVKTVPVTKGGVALNNVASVASATQENRNQKDSTYTEVDHSVGLNKDQVKKMAGELGLRIKSKGTISPSKFIDKAKQQIDSFTKKYEKIEAGKDSLSQKTYLANMSVLEALPKIEDVYDLAFKTQEENKINPEVNSYSQVGGDVDNTEHYEDYGQTGNKFVDEYVNKNYEYNKNDKSFYSKNKTTKLYKDTEKAKDWLHNWYTNRKIYNDIDGVYDGKKEYIKDDFGSSISELYEPLHLSKNKYFVSQKETPENNYGVYNSKNNNIILNNNLSKEDKDLTLIHELNHQIQKNNISKSNSSYMNNYEILLDGKVNTEGLEKYYKNKNYDSKGSKYLADPDEFHSRIMELRYKNDLKPNERFDENHKKYKQVLEDSKNIQGLDVPSNILIDALNRLVDNNTDISDYAQYGGAKSSAAIGSTRTTLRPKVRKPVENDINAMVVNNEVSPYNAQQYINAKLESKYTDAEDNFIIKDSKFNKRNNLSVPRTMLTDIIRAGKVSGVNQTPEDLMALAMRESDFGSGSQNSSFGRKRNPNQIFSNWYGEAGSNDPVREAEILKENIKYPFANEMATIKEKTKKFGIRGYNYGDPNYANKINQEKQVLQLPENKKLMQYADSVYKATPKNFYDYHRFQKGGKVDYAQSGLTNGFNNLLQNINNSDFTRSMKYLLNKGDYANAVELPIITAGAKLAPIISKTPGLKNLYKDAAYYLASRSGGSSDAGLHVLLDPNEDYNGNLQETLQNNQNLLKQYIYGNQPNFKKTNDATKGLSKYEKRYGKLDKFEMNSEVGYNKPISKKEVIEQVLDKGSYEERKKNMYAANAMQNNPILPLGDIAGHTVRVDTLNKNPYLISQDIWKFTPEDYAKKWARIPTKEEVEADAKWSKKHGVEVDDPDRHLYEYYSTKQKATLMDNAGKPFVLLSKNPIVKQTGGKLKKYLKY